MGRGEPTRIYLESQEKHPQSGVRSLPCIPPRRGVPRAHRTNFPDPPACVLRHSRGGPPQRHSSEPTHVAQTPALHVATASTARDKRGSKTQAGISGHLQESFGGAEPCVSGHRSFSSEKRKPCLGKKKKKEKKTTPFARHLVSEGLVTRFLCPSAAHYGQSRQAERPLLAPWRRRGTPGHRHSPAPIRAKFQLLREIAPSRSRHHPSREQARKSFSIGLCYRSTVSFMTSPMGRNGEELQGTRVLSTRSHAALQVQSCITYSQHLCIVHAAPEAPKAWPWEAKTHRRKKVELPFTAQKENEKDFTVSGAPPTE